MTAVVAALVFAALVLVGCGESSQAKAKAQVCGARSNISNEVKKLSELSLSTNALTEVKDGLEAIGSDLAKIKNEQSHLEPARKAQVESATHTFETRITSIISEVISNPSLSNVEKQLKSLLKQSANSYAQALIQVSCT